MKENLRVSSRALDAEYSPEIKCGWRFNGKSDKAFAGGAVPVLSWNSGKFIASNRLRAILIMCNFL